MVRYIIQKDGSGNDSPIGFDSCSGDGSSDREYLGRDGVHVLRNATSYVLADFALRYGFVSLHLAEALVQHIQSMDQIARQDSAVEHAFSYNVIPVFMN